MNNPITLSLPDLAATDELARKLATAAGVRDVLLLEGDLGTGKTTFARAFLQALGVQGDIPSPTFTLVQAYELPRGSVFHFDLYRLEDPHEIEEIGFDEACATGLVLIEWPDKARLFMPRDVLRLDFDILPDGQRCVGLSGGPSWQDKIKGLFNAN